MAEKPEIHPRANLQLIYVSDIERSTIYYTRLFGIEPVFVSPRYVAFPVEGRTLFALWTGAGTPDASARRYSEIGISLPCNDDVDALFDIWKDDPEIIISRPPYTEVFGRTFLVTDPDGHVIRVCPFD